MWFFNKNSCRLLIYTPPPPIQPPHYSVNLLPVAFDCNKQENSASFRHSVKASYCHIWSLFWHIKERIWNSLQSGENSIFIGAFQTADWLLIGPPCIIEDLIDKGGNLGESGGEGGGGVMEPLEGCMLLGGGEVEESLNKPLSFKIIGLINIKGFGGNLYQLVFEINRK